MNIGLYTEVLRNIKNGIGNYAYTLTKELIKIDKKNKYLLLKSQYIENPFKNIRQISIYHNYFFPLMLARNSFSQRFKDIDLFHFPSHQVCFYNNLLKKSIITIHDLTPLIFPEFHKMNSAVYFKYGLKPILKKSKVILADSENTKQDIIKYYRIEDEKIHVVYLGIDNTFRKLKMNNLSRFNLREKEYILFVGTLEPRKNIINMLKAYRTLQLKEKLVLISGPGWKNEELIKLCLETKNVEIIGNKTQEELIALYNGAKFLLYPSFYEGFGLPLVEAMACGCPVITSNTSSMPEVVGKAGVLINPYKIEEIADAIKLLNEDDKLRRTLSKVGLIQAQKFTSENMARNTLKVYEEKE